MTNERPSAYIAPGLLELPVKRKISPQEVIFAVSKVTEIPSQNITKQSRLKSQNAKEARYITAHLMKVECCLSNAKIGELLGGVDHSTINNYRRNFAFNLEIYRKFAEKFERVTKLLKR